MSLLHERATKVWLVLMVATCVTTWGLSKDAVSPAVAAVGIFLIAAAKVRFVVLDFMELRTAPLPVRIAFEAWIVVITLMILGFWLATPAVVAR